MTLLKELLSRGGLARYRTYRDALEQLANWSLPRWEPDDPQTEGEQMRLFAARALMGAASGGARAEEQYYDEEGSK